MGFSDEELNGRGPHADEYVMDAIGAIPGYASAVSLAQVQMAAAAKVLKLAQTAAAQPAAELLDAAMENVQQILSAMADDLGGQIDAYA